MEAKKFTNQESCMVYTTGKREELVNKIPRIDMKVCLMLQVSLFQEL